MGSHTRLIGFLLALSLLLASKTGLSMEIRVLITSNEFESLTHPEIKIKTNGNMMIVCYSHSLETNSSITLKPLEDGIKVIGEEQEYLMSSPVWIYPPVNGTIELTSVLRGGENKFIPSYPGFFEIHVAGKELEVINQVALEEYLYRVVPSEMPVTWPLEAIKAQAIASRTYVVKTILGAEEGRNYHVKDSILSQVYNNREEDYVAQIAVNQTRSLVMLDAHSMDLINAYYHSTSGGITAAAGDVWGHAPSNFPNTGITYLQARPVMASALIHNLQSEEQVKDFLKSWDLPCYEQNSPWYRWKITLTIEELEQIINANLAKQYQLQPDFILTRQPDGEFKSMSIPETGIGSLLELRVIKRGQGGNIITLEIHSTTGIYRVIKELNIRNVIQPSNVHTGGANIIIKRMTDQVENYPVLPSAFCTFEMLNDKVVIYGGGNGHGVGMSQWGAKGMAEAGYSFLDILQSFYTDIELINVYEFADIGI